MVNKIFNVRMFSYILHIYTYIYIHAYIYMYLLCMFKTVVSMYKGLKMFSLQIDFIMNSCSVNHISLTRRDGTDANCIYWARDRENDANDVIWWIGEKNCPNISRGIIVTRTASRGCWKNSQLPLTLESCLFHRGIRVYEILFCRGSVKTSVVTVQKLNPTELKIKGGRVFVYMKHKHVYMCVYIYKLIV